MKIKGLLSLLVLCFYIAVIMYVFFAVLHIDALANFEAAMTFEIIGFALLFYFILSKPVKLGFFVPIICTTAVYTIILDLINIAFVISLSHVFFVLINLILLLVYCIVVIPMYIVGKR